jgi:hypothetical protein
MSMACLLPQEVRVWMQYDSDSTENRKIDPRDGVRALPGLRIAAKDFETTNLTVTCGHVRSDPGVYSEISDGIA